MKKEGSWFFARRSMQMNYPKEYLSFIELFNEGEYFEAHEVLEDLWQVETDVVRSFYQGLIQIAAIFVHLSDDTPKGCPKILGTATGHLESFRPFFMCLDLEKLLEQTQNAIAGEKPWPKIELSE